MSREQAAIRAATTLAASSTDATSQRIRLIRFAVFPFILIFLLLAWAARNTNYYEPGSDFGYYLGVVGGVMLLALLLYSLRKHVRFMHSWGASRHWFRIHMIFGIAGPTLILFHSKFQVGSVNAAIALSCMLLVAGSGIVGRFIYRKIHHGLYGRSTTLQEIQARLGTSQNDVKSKLHFAAALGQHLTEFEHWALANHPHWWQRAWRFLAIGISARQMYRKAGRDLRRAMKAYATHQAWDREKYERRLQRSGQILRAHLNAVVDVARFTSYERLFSLWHILHVPFVFMLVISGVVHVIAVHMY